MDSWYIPTIKMANFTISMTTVTSVSSLKEFKGVTIQSSLRADEDRPK